MSFGTKEFWDTWYQNLLIKNNDSKNDPKNGGIVEWYVRFEQLKPILEKVQKELSTRYVFLSLLFFVIR